MPLFFKLTTFLEYLSMLTHKDKFWFFVHNFIMYSFAKAYLISPVLLNILGDFHEQF